MHDDATVSCNAGCANKSLSPCASAPEQGLNAYTIITVKGDKVTAYSRRSGQVQLNRETGKEMGLIAN